ncbi:hypothetical protein [Phytohabitans suffuscus]|uniref:hypothetical protein n=1 Tax=Phytohabitans suffuscus TaxID=624315 RepID=UPI001564D1E7|nr:hypothetical protein [Phytohabitans suffuscus]
MASVTRRSLSSTNASNARVSRSSRTSTVPCSLLSSERSRLLSRRWVCSDELSEETSSPSSRMARCCR